MGIVSGKVALVTGAGAGIGRATALRFAAEGAKLVVSEVAPDLRGEPLDPKAQFNEQFEFDSTDFLNFVAGLHRATGLELPEKDDPRLSGLESAIAYLAEKLHP